MNELLRGVPFWAAWAMTLAPLLLALTAARVAARALESRGETRLSAYVFVSALTWFPVGVVAAGAWVAGSANDGPLEMELLHHVMGLSGDHGAAWLVAWSAGLTLVFLTLGWAMVAVHRLLNVKMSDVIRQLKPEKRSEVAVWLGFVAPTAGFCEEYLFRGVAMMVPIALLDANPFMVIVATSFVFGLFHAVQGPIAMVGITAMGVAASLGVLWSGSLWPAIIAHTVYDMAVFFIFPLDEAEPAR